MQDGRKTQKLYISHTKIENLVWSGFCMAWRHHLQYIEGYYIQKRAPSCLMRWRARVLSYNQDGHVQTGTWTIYTSIRHKRFAAEWSWVNRAAKSYTIMTYKYFIYKKNPLPRPSPLSTILAIVRVSENRRTGDLEFSRSELGGIELGTSRSQVQRVTKTLLIQLKCR